MNAAPLPAHPKQKIAVIGAGWAGLAAALTLAKAGADVTLLERSPHAGGRAARAYNTGEKAPFALDNGQHVMIGAYSQVVSLLLELGVDLDATLLRLPAQWLVPNAMAIQQPAWCLAKPQWWCGAFKQVPMALGLLRDAWFNGGASATATTLLASIRMTLQPPKPTETVDAWVRRVGWSDRHIQYLWRPLCAATLNTPSQRANAQTFAKVVQDGLMAGPHAAAMLVPRGDLSALLAEPALQRLQDLGVNVRLHTPISDVQLTENSVCINNENFHQLIIATPPKDAWRLLSPHAAIMSKVCRAALEKLSTQAPEPITTLHLNVGAHCLNQAVYILPDSQEPALHNAVLIDRSYLDVIQSGWFTLVLSSSQAAVQYTDRGTTLTQATLAHLQTVFPQHAWPSDCPSVLIHAKQATFSCVADLQRPNFMTGLPRVWLVGDYVNSIENYPATLEGAVRNGRRISAEVLGYTSSNIKADET